MNLLDIARTLGMNVTQLCKVTGYSRQGMHQILNQENKSNPRRWQAAINALELNIVAKYNYDIRKAEEELMARTKVLTELRKPIIEKVTPCD